MPNRVSVVQEEARVAFTLIEIMIVVAIIGIITAVAIPQYLQLGRKSHRNACIANLKTLNQAIEQCRLGGEDGVVSMAMLCEPVGYIKGEPRCPADKTGHYDITGVVPLCPNYKKFPDKYYDHVLN